MIYRTDTYLIMVRKIQKKKKKRIIKNVGPEKGERERAYLRREMVRQIS